MTSPASAMPPKTRTQITAAYACVAEPVARV